MPLEAQLRSQQARRRKTLKRLLTERWPVRSNGAGIAFTRVENSEMPNGDYYVSITIPSLIVATYGGGTGLATQRECLEMRGCYGTGNVHKFAEIVAATVLCGELSLGLAIVAEEWVDAHDIYEPTVGRHRRHLPMGDR